MTGVVVTGEYARPRGRTGNSSVAHACGSVLALFFSRIAWRREEALPVPVGTAEGDFAVSATLAAVADVAVRSSLTCEGVSFRPKQNTVHTCEQSQEVREYLLLAPLSKRRMKSVHYVHVHHESPLRGCGEKERNASAPELS